ncbi:hypothetical protein EDC01DRAFT_641473 [Geopyxis carbonaria]|nr:hypothetical protein EDC01DRAFT_641473 [Geopyxis carbonaria]
MTRSTRPTFSSSSSSSSQPTTTNTTTSSTASTTPTPTPITAHPAGGPSRSLSLGIGLGFGLLLLLLALFTAWYLCARKRRTPPSPLASTSLHAGRSSPVEGAPAAAAALQRHGLTEEEVSLDSDEAAWQRAPLAGPQAVYIGDGRWRESRDGRWRESRVRPGPPVLPALDLGEESLKWEGLRRFEEGGTERI